MAFVIFSVLALLIIPIGIHFYNAGKKAGEKNKEKD